MDVISLSLILPGNDDDSHLLAANTHTHRGSVDVSDVAGVSAAG